MKPYQNRNELIKDIDFIKSIILDYEYMNHIIHILFRQWMETSPDSPWYSKNTSSIEEELISVLHERDLLLKLKEDRDKKKAANTLLKISKEGISNEWCGEHTIFTDINPPKVRSKHYNLRNI